MATRDPRNIKILPKDTDGKGGAPEPPPKPAFDGGRFEVVSNFKVKERSLVHHIDGTKSVVSTRENGDHEIRNFDHDGREMNNEQVGRDKSHKEIVHEVGLRDGGKATVEKIDTD